MLRRIWNKVPIKIRDLIRPILYAVDQKRISSFRTMCPDTPPAIKQSLGYVNARGVSGDYLEFGLFAGYTFWYAQKTATELRLEEMRFLGFDSFEGLPQPVGCDNDFSEFNKGDYACNYETVTRHLNDHGVDWKKTFLIKGFYDDTLTTTVKEALGIKKVAVALIDCDLYSSTVPVLNFLDGAFQDGSVLLFDDWNTYHASDQHGQRRAFREYLTEHPEWMAEPFIAFGWHGQAFVMRQVTEGASKAV
jgi:O-methyltransferase